MTKKLNFLDINHVLCSYTAKNTQFSVHAHSENQVEVCARTQQKVS